MKVNKSVNCPIAKKLHRSGSISVADIKEANKNQVSFKGLDSLQNKWEPENAVYGSADFYEFSLKWVKLGSTKFLGLLMINNIPQNTQENRLDRVDQSGFLVGIHQIEWSE